MGKHITLICDETPGLKLGPGAQQAQTPGQVIRFFAGFAEFEADDFPEWQSWISALGTPHIEVVESDSGQVSLAAGLGFDCPVCGKGFGTQHQLNGHRMSHFPKRTPVTA